MARRLKTDGRAQRNRRRHVSTVRSMLSKRFCTLLVEFQGEFIRAQHDAIVSDVLFRQAGSPNGSAC